MKKSVIIIILIATVFTSCKNSEKQEEPNSPKEAVQEQVDGVFSNQWKNDIQLNNSAKWQADAKTNEGVQKIQNTIETQITNTLDDYHQLANKLNDDKNYVVKNCTMKGASHDNLHVWLLPLMDKIKALSEAKTVEEASKLKYSIEENVNAYSDYFE